MVVQYPDKITATIVAGSTQDENGNWISGTATTREDKGRAEVNNSGRMVQLSDGSQVAYNWIVYMPKGTAAFAIGTQVTITRDGTSIANGKVLRFHPGQLNCRLWL